MCAPGVRLSNGNEYQLTPIQAKLWDKWEGYWEDIDYLKSLLGATVTTIMDGDMIDNNKHPTTERISGNEAVLLRAAYATLTLAAVVSDSIVMIRGTAAHTGNSGELEEILAKDIGAKPWADGNYSGYQFEGTVGGMPIFAQHHPGGGARQPWGRGGASNTAAAKTVFRFAENNMAIPKLAFFGHTHAPEDSGDNHICRAIFLPSWKLTDDFGHRFGGDWLPIGSPYVIIKGEHYDVRKDHYFKWPNVQHWEL